MRYLEKLLEGVKVEWKRLGEIADYIRGLTYSKLNESSGKLGYKVLRANNITLGSNNLNFDDIKVVKYETKVKAAQKLYRNDILMSAASGSREHVGKVAFVYEDLDYYFGGFMGVVRCSRQIEPRFMFHILGSIFFQNYLDNVLNSSTINNLSSAIVNTFLIPIPPLSVQQEIVRILDQMTQLTAELTEQLNTELAARKKQYEYYREALLSFEEGEVEWKKLGEIGEFQRGKRFVKDDMTLKGISCIHYGEMYTYYNIWARESKSYLSEELVESKKLRLAEHGDVVIVAAGETIEDIGRGTAWLGKQPTVIHDACFSYRSSLNPKFVAYFTRTKQFQDQVRKHVSSGKISAIHANGLSKVAIPVPSQEEQARIVSILDKFDTLTHSISEGLPKEIALRQQQYEYYRDLLLDFPKPEI